MSKAGGTAFRKDVAFVTKDEDEQIASGIVMVPDKVDLQNDFAREETIRSFADQFAAFEEAGQAGGGIMHAVWPDGWMELERNEVLDEEEEIGGQTVAAGAWVQDWSIENGELWELIDEGVLEGYSIGAIQVDWDGPWEQDEVDDVDTSEVPEEELVWELTDGIIREVSAVDIPAVPDAEILEAKALEKRLADHLGNRDGFIEEAMERGHTEAEAQRLWDVLNEAVEAEGSEEPGKDSVFERAGKAFLKAISGTDDDGRSEAPDRGAAKEGRTLSKQNRESAMAAVDANLDILQDAGVDHGMTRFTDQDGVDFDLTEHSARTWAGDTDDPDEEDEEEEEESAANNAAGGETPDDTTDMSDDNTTDDPWDEAPEWARDLRDDVQENSQRIDDAVEASEEPDDGEKTADADDDPWADAPEWAKALKDDVDENAERIDTITRQSGRSQQLEQNGENETESGLDGIGKALS